MFFFSVAIGFGQQLFVQKYSQEVYQGSDQSWQFAQDKKGVIYVANNDGVLTYDGEKWGLIPLPDRNYVLAMAFDSRERLYVGSYNDLGYLQKDGSGKYQYHSLAGLLPESYRTIKNVSQIAIFRDTVFFRGPDYIYRYAGGTFQWFPTKTGHLLQFRGRVFLLDDDGLHPYKNGSFGPVDPNDGLREIRISRIKDYTGDSCLLLDDKSRLWVYDPDAAPGRKLRLFSGSLEAYCKDSPILSMLYLDNGTIALLQDKGLLFVDKDGAPVNFISKEMLGSDIRYARLLQDMRHNLWMMATDSYIFQLITSSPLSYYDKDNGIAGEIISLGRSGEYRYVGTAKGIFYQGKDKGFSLIPTPGGETWNFYTFHGKEYVAHETGVFELEGTRLRKLIDQASVHCLGEWKGHPDCLLMGTFSDGIWLLEKNGNTWYKKKIKGFEEEVRSLQGDEEGNIWVGHNRKGIFKLRLNEKLDSVTATTLYDHNKGLPSAANNRLFHLRNGNMVATTADGIYGYDRAKDRFDPLPEFRKALPEGWIINNIAETPDGDLFFNFGSAEYRQLAGFLHRRPGGGFELVQAPFHKMAIPTHGPRIDDDYPLLVTGPAEVWFGTGEKLVTYDPAKKTFYDEPVRAFIDRVRSKDSVLFNGDPLSTPAILPFDGNKLRFDLLSSDYEAPEKVQYQYRLDGFDHQWSDWSLNREAAFTNLREGSYTFWARARDMYGRVSEPVPFSFSIRPPWYRTWWAYLLCLLALFLLLYALIKINARRILRKNIALERKVEEKTGEILEQAKVLRELNSTKDKLFSIISHDLRGPIGTMKSVVDLMKNQAMSEQDVRSFSVELSEHLLVTGHLLNNLLFWANAQMEGIRSAPAYVDLQEIAVENCQLFKALTESKNIRMINAIEAGFEVYADRDILKMVLRNLINNAIKFTGSGGEIHLSAARGGGYTEITVTDTGTGLSGDEICRIIHKQVFHKPDTEGQLGAGLGLMLCMELIEKDGAFLEIRSEPGKGSRFTVKIPS